jgi:hypothetical protein
MGATRLQPPPASAVQTSLDDADHETPRPLSFDCDLCGRTFEGIPDGAGLLLWTRGEEFRYEEPPLCEECASKVSIGALLKWDAEEEEEG